jgi:hypothetical protein
MFGKRLSHLQCREDLLLIAHTVSAVRGLATAVNMNTGDLIDQLLEFADIVC